MLLLLARAVGRDAVAGSWGLRVASRGAAVHADNQIEAAGAASLAPSLGRIAQLTSLDLAGTLACIGGQLRYERVFASAGNAPMMLRAAGCSGFGRGCRGWLGLLRGASRGAAERAVNSIGEDGTASLAPSLERMTQLTELDLSGTLRASGAAVLGADACERRQCDDAAACCTPGWMRAGL